MVDSQFTEDSGVADFNEQVWRVLRERGHTETLVVSITATGLSLESTTSECWPGTGSDSPPSSYSSRRLVVATL